MVTGASRGIGKALAIGLVRAGADIVGVSRNGPGPDVSEAVEAMGKKFTSYAVDLSNREAVIQFGAVMRDTQSIDVLVNNAGILRRGPAASHPLEWWDEVIEVNLSAQFLLTQMIGQSMLERKEGKIVFIGSMLSFQGGLGVLGYTASKSGIVGLTKAFANEWAVSGINVNALAPGYMSPT